VFEVLGLVDEVPPEVRWRHREFAHGLEFYRQARFHEAQVYFETVLAEDPGDGPAKTFLERCYHFQIDPPPSPWDTVFRPDAK
jgi:adenylate cyclase